MARRALVTGAARGIGSAIAKELQLAGFELLLPSRTELNLADKSSIDRFVGQQTKTLDVLVNNAGINILSELKSLADSDLERTIQVNLLGPLRLMRGLMPLMISNRYGRIVNLSSIWGSVSKPGRLAYSASKAGLEAATRSAALELAPYNILVNAIAPGFVDTELTRKNLSPTEIGKIKGYIPLNRFAQPTEIAKFVVFLCSENNSYLTGQTILVDGGYTCQ